MISAVKKTDLEELSELNAQFIQNFINQDAVAHSKIIHDDFVCIQSTGIIVDRDQYLKGWESAYSQSGYKTFSYTDESIRIFGTVALIRSRTVYTKIADGKEVSGSSVYTDTYTKENERWLCIQAQITPVK
jgi:ketosteroid isomerase-like protein